MRPPDRFLVAVMVLLATCVPVLAQGGPEGGPAPGKSGQPAVPQSARVAPTTPALSVPQPEALLLMVRAALIALDQANKTGNYSVLHGIGGPMFQQHTPARLADFFTGIRQANVDLQPTLILTPQITQAPQLTPQGVVTLTGFFATQPMQIQFQVSYQAVGGLWRLAGLNVTLAPIAAPPQPQPAATAQPEQRVAPAKKSSGK